MKCLDCGYNIMPDEASEHKGHEIVEGFWKETMTEQELREKVVNSVYDLWYKVMGESRFGSWVVSASEKDRFIVQAVGLVLALIKEAGGR